MNVAKEGLTKASVLASNANGAAEAWQEYEQAKVAYDADMGNQFAQRRLDTAEAKCKEFDGSTIYFDALKKSSLLTFLFVLCKAVETAFEVRACHITAMHAHIVPPVGLVLISKRALAAPMLAHRRYLSPC